MAMRMYPADYPWNEVPSVRSHTRQSVAPSPGIIPTGVVGRTTHHVRITMYDGGRRQVAPDLVTCPTCGGRGRYMGKECPTCQGTGKVAASSLSLEVAGGTSAPDEYLGEYQKAYDEARQANEGRYQDILAQLDKMGSQERADIRSRYAAARSGGLHDLVQRGLMGTTLAPSLRALYAREETADTARLEERLRGERLGFMERRTDTYPDESTMLGLAQGAGRYGAAAPSGTLPSPTTPAAGVGAPAYPTRTGGAVCLTCRGTGLVNGQVCPICHGTGKAPPMPAAAPAGAVGGLVPWSGFLPGSKQPVRPPGPLGPMPGRPSVSPRLRLYGMTLAR